MFDKISIGIKTFLRDDKLFKTIEGIRKNMPDAHMIIADDGRPSIGAYKVVLYHQLQKEGHTIICMPFDSGFGAKSNAIANALERPYLLVASDDFDFNPVSVAVGIQKMQAALELCSTAMVMSGRVNNNPYEFFLSDADGVVKEHPIPDLGAQLKFVCRSADLTVNYSLIRKEVFEKVRWDDEAKIGQGEHGAFFVDLKRAGFRVGCVFEANINEQEGEDSVEYKMHRSRANSSERSCFKKRGIKTYILGNGAVDYMEGWKL